MNPRKFDEKIALLKASENESNQKFNKLLEDLKVLKSELNVSSSMPNVPACLASIPDSEYSGKLSKPVSPVERAAISHSNSSSQIAVDTGSGNGHHSAFASTKNVVRERLVSRTNKRIAGHPYSPSPKISRGHPMSPIVTSYVSANGSHTAALLSPYQQQHMNGNFFPTNDPQYYTPQHQFKAPRRATSDSCIPDRLMNLQQGAVPQPHMSTPPPHPHVYDRPQFVFSPPLPSLPEKTIAENFMQPNTISGSLPNVPQKILHYNNSFESSNSDVYSSSMGKMDFARVHLQEQLGRMRLNGSQEAVYQHGALPPHSSPMNGTYPSHTQTFSWSNPSQDQCPTLQKLLTMPQRSMPALQPMSQSYADENLNDSLMWESSLIGHHTQEDERRDSLTETTAILAGLDANNTSLQPTFDPLMNITEEDREFLINDPDTWDYVDPVTERILREEVM